MSTLFAGRFLLRHALGTGGMGTVHLARDLARGTECAVKMLDGRATPEFAEALRREFQSLAAVRHPVVVDVHELGFAPDGQPYLVTEYVPGVHADQALEPRDLGAVLWCMARVADALEALHAAGVVHGDIKPANILVVTDSVSGQPADVRLVDFGLATVLGRMPGARGGTPGFGAPETGSGRGPDPTADLYAFGATLHALLVGEVPFGQSRSSQRPTSPAEHAPPAAPLERAGVPGDLVHLVLGLLSPRPEDRPRSAREVRRELERIHPRARRPLAERLRAAACVGRERELGWIRGEAQRADGGPGGPGGTRVVLVTGREGAGKSTLLREAATRLRLEGRDVHFLSPHDGQTPWAALATLLQMTPCAPDALDRYAQALAGPSATGSAPLIIVDDAHLHGEEARRWLLQLALHAPSPRVTWLLAMEHLTPDAALLAAAGYSRECALQPLGDDAVARLASLRLGAPADAVLVRWLLGHTGGWPLEVVQALQRAAVVGAIRESDSGLLTDIERLADATARDDSLPERFAALPADAQHALLVIAACGGHGDHAGLAVCGVVVDEACAAALTDSGLARDDAGWWRTHPTTANAVLALAEPAAARAAAVAALARAALPPERRFELHELLGERAAALADAEDAMRRSPSRDFARRVARVLGDDPAAAAWWLRSAELARAAGRHDHAEPAYAEALSRAQDPQVRAQAHAGYVSSLLSNGQLDRLGAAITAALAEPLPDELRTSILLNDAARMQRLGRTADATARARDAVAMAERSGSGAAISHARRGLAAHAQWDGRLDEAAREAKAAHEAAELADDPQAAARSAVVLGGVLLRRGDRTAAEAALTEALAMTRDAASAQAREEALWLRAAMRVESGDWAAGTEDLESALRLALQDGRRDAATSYLPFLATLDAYAGRTVSARRRARAAWRMVGAHSPALRPEAARAVATVLRMCGAHARGERWARRALDLAIGRHPASYETWARCELGQVLLRRGRAADALSVCTHDRDPAAVTPEALLLRMVRALAHVALGERAPAERLAGEAAEGLRDSGWAYGHAQLEALQGRLALARGDGGAARELGVRAVEHFRARPAPGDAAWTALELCEDALQRGLETHFPIESLLDRAIEQCERLGDRRCRARAHTALIEALRRRERRGGGSAEATDLLKQIRTLLGSMSSIEEISDRALNMALRHFRAERGVLLLRAEDSEQLHEVASVGDVDATTLRSAHGYSRRVVDRVQESRLSVVIDDASDHLEWASQSIMDMGIRRVACAPLLVGTRCVGALYLDSRQVSGAFDEHDRHILDELARLLGVAIHGARTQVAIQHQVEELSDENRSLRRALTKRHRIAGFVADSPAMQEVLAQVESASRSDLTVLLTGESGTGKEELARQIHMQSRRRKGPFLTLNCGAVPAELLASELFGILEGVATGVKHRRGKFELADGGTLFLDEIGDMPRDQQVALLRVLQTREVTPVGGHRPVVVDVRIVAATNRDLHAMARAREFRQDLYYRLAVFPVHVPPLRDRKQDIPAMVQQIVARASEQLHTGQPLRLARDFLPTVLESDWPGNVRELQNYVERIAAMTEDGVLRPHPLPADLQATPAERPAAGSRLRPLSDAVRELEERLIDQALRVTSGNQVRAAHLLDITEQSLRYRLRKYQLAGGRRRSVGR